MVQGITFIKAGFCVSFGRNVNKMHFDFFVLNNLVIFYSCLSFTLYTFNDAWLDLGFNTCNKAKLVSTKRKHECALSLCPSVFAFAVLCFLYMYFSNCGPSGATSPKVYSDAGWGLNLGN